MNEQPIKLPPITKDMLPKSIEQQMLEVLKRIEKLLEAQAPKPVQTPAPQHQSQQQRKK